MGRFRNYNNVNHSGLSAPDDHGMVPILRTFCVVMAKSLLRDQFALRHQESRLNFAAALDKLCLRRIFGAKSAPTSNYGGPAMLSRKKDFEQFAKRLVKASLGRDHLIKKDVSIEIEKLGTNYGGWVVSRNLLRYTAQPIVMSFGIGDDISFDLELIRRYQARVFAYDPTPKAIEWVSKQRIPEAMAVYQVGLANIDGEQDFGLPDNPNWDDFSIRRNTDRTVRCPVARLPTIMRDSGVDDVDVMKMDIEGSEYAVIEDLCRSDIRPKQFLVEFHHGTHGIAIEETRKAVASLRAAGYLIFDISPWGREFSFVHDSAMMRATG